LDDEDDEDLDQKLKEDLDFDLLDYYFKQPSLFS